MIIVDEYAPAQPDEELQDLLGRGLSPKWTGVGADTASGPARLSTEWACTNCLREFKEPFCAECGANLMEVTR